MESVAAPEPQIETATASLRWFIDFDGEKILQQAWVDQETGATTWKNIPVFDYYDRERES